MEYPTEWDRIHPPSFPVIKEISRDKDGIFYSVLVAESGLSIYEDDEITVWSRYVEFTPLNRSGGPAFQGAAEEQDRIADEWAAALERFGTNT